MSESDLENRAPFVGTIAADHGAAAVAAETPAALDPAAPSPRVVLDGRRATDQFRTIFNSVTDGILIFEPAGRILEANRVVCQRLGYEREQLLEMNVKDLDTPASAALFDGRIQSVIRQGFATFELEHRRRDGSVIPLEVGSKTFDFEGVPAILSVQRDITERRRAEAEAEAQRRYVEELLEAIPTPIIAKDRDGRIQQCNEAFVRISGRTRGEVLGRTVREIGLNVSADSDELDREVVTSGQIRQQETWMPLANGAGRLLLTRAPMKTADGTVRGTITTAMDITERYLAEQALRRSEERFRTLFDKASDAIYIVDTTGKFIDVNNAAAEKLGYTETEMLEMGVSDICLPEDAGNLPVLIPMVLARGGLAFETRHVHKDGGQIPIELALTPMELDGKTVILGIARDVSERKRAEAERALLESQLRQAQKMEGIGRLASGIAHDFNNLLTAISGFAGFALEGLGEDEDRRHDIEQIQEAAGRAATLVRQLLAFSRSNKVEPKLTQPGEVVARLERLLRPMIGEDIELSVDVADCHSCVLADAGQIEQVIVNFAVNARDAMRKGGHLRIRVADVALDEEQALATGGKPGPNVVLEVSDDGAGMEPETMEHLFEPFFTTKGPGEGTGLGLAVVYGIVHTWGGGLSVASTPGRGATFAVYLPAVEAVAQRAAGIESPGIERIGLGRKVLVVEDDEVVRRFTVRVLESAGFDVFAPLTAPEAVALGRVLDVDLLLTDVVMPSLLGAEVASEIGDAHPEMPVLYMSGYSDPGLKTSDHRFYLPKPFTALELLSAVAEALGG